MLALSVLAVNAAVPVLPGDFSANVTVLRGGLTYQGMYKMDGAGGRFFKHIGGLEENTYVYQWPGKYVTFTYTNNTAGCDCLALQDGLLEPWVRLNDAVKTGNCSGGELWESSGKAFVGAPVYRACIAADGTPVYTEEDLDRVTYNTFTKGRPDFPMPNLLSCQASCNANTPTLRGALRAVAAGAVEEPPSVARDFTADVTFTQGGLSNTGRIIHDGTGRRTFKYTSGLEEYTYSFQVPGRSITQTYTNNTAGCACLTSRAVEINEAFPQLRLAAKAGACGNGTLWVGQSDNLVNVPQQKVCLTPDGTPLWSEESGIRIDYNNFVAGRPSFPNVDLVYCQASCNQNAAANAAPAAPAPPAKVSKAEVWGNSSLYTTIADFTAEVTFVESGLSYKGMVMVDSTGRRTFSYTSELEDYSYRYQAPGVVASYKYSNMTSGCMCQNYKDELVGDYWVQLNNAIKTGPCEGGDMWEDDAKNLVGVGSFKLCIDTASGTPLYTQRGATVVKFDKFTTGRPDFPAIDFTFCQADCHSQ